MSINRQLWEYAELGLQEHRSSRLLAEILQREGFRVHKGVADLPTAFVATFGVGSPVIGLLAEYDALPELSQTTAPEREPVKAGNPGHGCGHSGLGAGACGAALAIKEALQLHRLPGTIKLYGTPAEESLIGKVYMLRAGLFSDLDVCLHWHPANRNEVWAGSSKAAVSAKFRFYGAAAHAAGAPHRGRSALDGVELMNIGVNFMREHVKEDARIHYVITAGGGAPNVIPAFAEVWYYVRADQHHDVEHYFEWLQEIARGAAMMSRTKCEIAIETDCHELLSNTPLAEVMMRNLLRINPPTYTAEEQAWAGRLLSNTPDAPADRDFILDHRIHKLPAGTEHSKGSTDVGDISWHVPTIG
ncbi:MAG: glutamate carboxypeptidase [Planctomycetaceae bacterium]|nr:MAG: glutamate carboxypeptidase [Planctomycetaceae bacterium]